MFVLIEGSFGLHGSTASDLWKGKFVRTVHAFAATGCVGGRWDEIVHRGIDKLAAVAAEGPVL